MENQILVVAKNATSHVNAIFFDDFDKEYMREIPSKP